MVYYLISAAIFAVDQVCKRRIEKEPDEFQKCVCKDRLLLQKSHNRGAIMHVMEKYPKELLGISGGLAAGILYGLHTVQREKGRFAKKMGLAMLLGGACSNLYDRIRHHYVIDYFSFRVKWEKLRKIVFNIGDMFIFLGAMLLTAAQIPDVTVQPAGYFLRKM